LKFRIIVRRLTSYGGAEFIALRFARFLHSQNLLEEVVCGRNEEGELPFKVREVGFLRPGRFLKTYSFQRRVANYLKGAPKGVNFAFSKVPDCHVYINGGGVHASFLKSSIKAYSGWRAPLKALSRSLNPVNYLNPLLERKILKTSKKIVAVSSVVKEELLFHYSFLNIEEKIEVVPNPVDVEKFNREKRKELRTFGRELVKARRGEFIVGFASSNFRLKGLHLLIEALVHLPKKVKLAVAGGRNPKEFLKLAQKLGVRERVVFLGKVKGMELFYSGIDLLAHPSYYDTFGNVVAEALSMGVPTICSNKTGAKDFIDEGKNGFILKTFSPKEIAQKIALSMKREWDFKVNLPCDREVFRRYVEIGEQSLRLEQKG